MSHDDVRNVPPAQRLLREGGLCSVFWRLPEGRPVLCALPTDEPHDHYYRSPYEPTEGCPVEECPYMAHTCPTKAHRSSWRRLLLRLAES